MNRRGFTLLEVLVALAILGASAVFMLRLAGGAQTRLADDAWKNSVVLEGRNRLVELELEARAARNRDVSTFSRWGTLAPLYPDVRWKASARPLTMPAPPNGRSASPEYSLWQLTLRLEDPSGREALLEQFYSAESP